MQLEKEQNFGMIKKKFSIFANEIFTINIISTIIAYILLVFTVAAVPKFKDYAVIIAVLVLKFFLQRSEQNGFTLYMRNTRT